jgi:hypothetical protein
LSDDIRELLMRAAGTAPAALGTAERDHAQKRGRQLRRASAVAATVTAALSVSVGSWVIVASTRDASGGVSQSLAGAPTSAPCASNATPIPDSQHKVDYSGDRSKQSNSDGRRPMSADEAAALAKKLFLPHDVDPTSVKTTVTEVRDADAREQYGLSTDPAVGANRCVFAVDVAGPPTSDDRQNYGSYSVVFDLQSGALLGSQFNPR